MNGKQKNTNSFIGFGPKKQRKAIDLDIKIEVVNKYEKGRKFKLLLTAMASLIQLSLQLSRTK